MELSVIRYSSGEESTLGILMINGKFVCYTLEDEARTVKVAGKTRIPSGRYRVRLRKEGGHHERYAQKFPAIHKGMLHITNVPDFRWILIHIGNDDEATEGCLLVGDEANNNNIRDGFIKNSANAYQRIYPEIANAIDSGEETWITYYDNIPFPEKESIPVVKNSAIIAADRLNFRKSPSGSIKGELFEGTVAEINETTGNWTHINVEGWVSASYLKEV